jgi:hypothetical protein
MDLGLGVFPGGDRSELRSDDECNTRKGGGSMNANSKNSEMQKYVELKKPYARPQVLVYGTIREITQALANMSSNSDGGVGSNKKTA